MLPGSMEKIMNGWTLAYFGFTCQRRMAFWYQHTLKPASLNFYFNRAHMRLLFFPICPVIKTPRAAKNQNISNLKVAEMENKEAKIRDNIQDFHESL